MLSANDFSDTLWDVLDRAQGNEGKLRAILTSLPREYILTFRKEFRRAMRQLWNKSDASGWLRPRPGDQLSEDEKEDIFAYVVSQGRDYYNEILSHPERLRRDVDPGEVPALWVPGQVFWERFGEEITLQ